MQDSEANHSLVSSKQIGKDGLEKNLDLMSKFEQPGKDFTTREPP